jgi:uncharacterized phage-associated protein
MEKQELQVAGITRQDFEHWKHEPVTKLFRKYLADKRAFLREAVTERWINGGTDLQLEHTVRGQIVELAELILLSRKPESVRRI